MFLKYRVNFFICLALVSLKLAVTATAVEIVCREFGSHYWVPLGNVLTCSDNPSLVETSEPGVKISKIVDIDGTDISTNTKVEGFYINEAKNLKYMPRGVTKIFPFVKGIAIWSSGLSHLSKDDFEEFGNRLIYAGFLNCRIETLEVDLLEHNPNLKMIRFDGNPLKLIDPKFFVNLRKLSHLEHARFALSDSVNQDFEKQRDGSIQDFEWNLKVIG